MSDDPQARAQARIGAVLNDKWTLERLLGLGGMAAVYAGRHRNGARGAVKLLHPELARTAELRERFLREGYAANRVEHAGAVKVLDDDVVSGGPDSGTAYLIMELLEGESLDDRMRRRPGPFAEEEALAIAESVLDVLDAAHTHGVIHRDLKPENLFLENPAGSARTPFGFGRVKVLDFGLARVTQGESTTHAGMALGTPSFMAPEQADGRGDEIDGRTDLFAIGATLFRILTERRIHDAPGLIELVTKMARIPAPAIRSVRANVSEPVAAIVDRALRFRREDRYANADAMRADVRAARAGRALPSAVAIASTQRIELSSDELTPAEPSFAEPATPAVVSRAELGSGAGSSSASISHSASTSYTGAGASVPMRYGGCLAVLFVMLIGLAGTLFLTGVLTTDRVMRFFRGGPASSASAPTETGTGAGAIAANNAGSGAVTISAGASSSSAGPSAGPSTAASTDTDETGAVTDAGDDTQGDGTATSADDAAAAALSMLVPSTQSPPPVPTYKPWPKPTTTTKPTAKPTTTTKPTAKPTAKPTTTSTTKKH